MNHIYKGRKVKFYAPTENSSEEHYEEGIMHQWFLVTGSIVVPYALIERNDGSMVFVNYHDVIFSHERELTLDDLIERGGSGV